MDVSSETSMPTKVDDKKELSTESGGGTVEQSEKQGAKKPPAKQRDGKKKKQQDGKKKKQQDGKKKKPNDKQKLRTVPEFLLKKRKAAVEKRAKLQQKRILSKTLANLKRKVIFKRAEAYVREYRQKKKDEERMKMLARKNHDFYVPAEPRLAFAIRIRGINGVSPRVRKILQLFRLRQINNGIFMKLNGATLNMLRLVEPYITWGYPNLNVVRGLVYKRGYGKIRSSRIPLTNNKMIEESLGSRNVICMEDIVHEIYTTGPNFKAVTNFLWPFKLNNPKGGWRKKANHYVEGGDYGCRENLINDLLVKMI